MTDGELPCTITPTPAASDALRLLAKENGPIVLHITAGTEDSGTPMCLPADELKLGPRDILVGTVDDVLVYEMKSHADGHFRNGSFVLDVSRGLPVGFSLTPGDHMRFVIRDSRPA